MNTYLRRIVAWLRQGYPTDQPTPGYQPLLALLRRRLTDSEVAELGAQLLRNGLTPADRVDIAVSMTMVTNTLPTPQEVSRVCERLRDKGFAVDLHAGGLS